MAYAEGIDVSKYQPSIAGVLRLHGRSLCIVKVSEGTTPDPLAAQHFAACRAAHVDWMGAYHYLRIEVDGAAQARAFLALVPDDVDFLCLDVEGRSLYDPATHGAFLGIARYFILTLRALDPKHRPILLYSSRGTWPGALGQDANWCADYAGDPNRFFARPRVPWIVWQYTSRADGMNLDADRFDEARLAALCGRDTPAPPVLPPSEDHAMKFIQMSSADVANLPSVAVPEGTRIEDFEGGFVSTVGPTSLRRLPGLVDAHTDHLPVVVVTGRYYADGLRRYTGQVAVLPK